MGVHVLTGTDAIEFSASFGAEASLYEDLVKAIGTKNPTCIAKRLADGILSAIDCVVKLEKKKGERGVLTIDAKFLQYKEY